jgi:hypothetical protein
MRSLPNCVNSAQNSNGIDGGGESVAGPNDRISRSLNEWGKTFFGQKVVALTDCVSD